LPEIFPETQGKTALTKRRMGESETERSRRFPQISLAMGLDMVCKHSGIGR
jgi:hypothetical protein